MSDVSTTQAAFATLFGADQARAIMCAAESHENGVHDKRGSDPFKWALSICIGYQCFERDGYRAYHGIRAPYDEIKQWIIDHGDLGTHDGDVDFLGLAAGAYNDYMPTAAQP